MIQGKPVKKMGVQAFVRWAQRCARSAVAGLAIGVLGGTLAVGSALAPAGAAARETLPDAQALATVALSALPEQARQTHQRILAGGPFPYSKDGTVFRNRERRLPAQPRGFYREYTVATPGATNRGARRIVCGGKEPKAPEVCYYTPDHYASFMRITP